MFDGDIKILELRMRMTGMLMIVRAHPCPARRIETAFKIKVQVYRV